MRNVSSFSSLIVPEKRAYLCFRCFVRLFLHQCDGHEANMLASRGTTFQSSHQSISGSNGILQRLNKPGDQFGAVAMTEFVFGRLAGFATKRLGECRVV